MAAGGKTAFAFPGVGVKFCGEELPFYERHRPLMRPLLDEASGVCGVDLAAALAAGTAETLPDRHQQFFSYAYAAGALGAFAEQSIAPDFTAGFSFGIYAALYAAGAVGFGEGLAMLDEAYRLMSAKSEGQGHGMAVLVGLELAELVSLLDAGGWPSIAVVNTANATCQILSGNRAELAALLAEARRRDAFSAELLDVAIPYHHPRLLAGVSRDFDRFLSGLAWRDPAVPVVCSIDGRLLTNAGELRQFAAHNLDTPISWQTVVGALHAAGATRVVECGPGLSLTQNGRFLPFALEYLNIKKARRWAAG